MKEKKAPILYLDEEKIGNNEEDKAGKNKNIHQKEISLVSMKRPIAMKSRTDRRKMALNFLDEKGRTCLHYACASGKVISPSS